MKITKQRLKEIIREELTESGQEPATTVALKRTPDYESEAPRGAPGMLVTDILTHIVQIENDLTKFRKRLEDVLKHAASRNIDQHPPPGAGTPSLRHSVDEAKSKLQEVKRSLKVLLERI